MASVPSTIAPAPAPAPLAPGPRWGVPLLGQVFEAWRDPLGLFMRARAEHGDVVRFKFGHLRYHLVSDPEGIRHVLVDNAKAYTKSRNYKGLKLVLGQGLLTSEGDFWRRQRKLAQPAFHREKMSAFAEAMGACAGQMLERWGAHPDSAALDVHAELMRVTFQIVGRTLLSTDLDDPNGAVGKALSVVLQFANDYAESFFALPPWVPTPRNARFKRALRTLDDIVLGIIEQRRRSPDAHNDLLSMLMAVRDQETNESMTDRQLRDEVITIVLAGHETTANALAWTLYLLSRHPDVERRVAAELRDVLGGRAPSLADLPRLTFTKMVIEESLRLYPPAWAFERQAVEPDVICGYAIAPGDIVGISPYAVHRHPRHWDNPEGFDPERFRPERVEGRPRYAYLPFGGGPRVCIGNGFAMMEAQVLLAAIVQHARLELVPDHPVELSPLITLRPKHGLRMTLHRRAPAAAISDAPLGPSPAPP
jgi:cytochrome P450